MNLVNKIGQYLQPGRSWYKRNVGGVTHLVVHHSVTYTEGKTNDQMLNELFQIHKNNGWPGLSYHRVITPDGTVYQINNHDDLTWTDSHNDDSLAVCLIGYFHPPANMKPTKEQLKALKECLDEWCTKHPEFPADQDDVWGHRDRWATACPGDLAYPYPTEYRTKKGDVNWESGAPAPVGGCLLENTEENRKTFEKLVNGATVRKEVAEYLEIANPDTTQTEEFKKVIGGIKSSATAANNALNKEIEDHKKTSTELGNREEQVSRLKGEVLQASQRENSLSDQLKKAGVQTAEAVKVYQGQLQEKQNLIDTLAKEKGAAQNNAAEWKGKYETLSKQVKEEAVKQLSAYDVLAILVRKAIPFLKNIKLDK